MLSRGVPPSVHPSMCWVILKWASISSSLVSLAPHFPDLRRLGAFSYLPCSVNWLRIDLVVLSYISEFLDVIFPHWVSTRVSPSWWIRTIPSRLEFLLLYHYCITEINHNACNVMMTNFCLLVVQFHHDCLIKGHWITFFSFNLFSQWGSFHPGDPETLLN